jgi:GDP-4-dehydro-6-deoxy-D-mannose reductase
VTAPPLVTGATGFAGSHLVDQLLQDVPHVAAWARAGGRAAGDAADGRVTWSAIDLLDGRAMAAALEALRPSAIYHCAGVAQVGNSWARGARALEVNALGTHRLLEALRETGLGCPVLVTGSALVYRQSSDPIDERQPIGPGSPYAVSKLAQEMVAARATDLPVFIVRPFNHAGPRQDDSFVTSSFARQIAEIEAGLREPVLRVGNLESRRDVTDVRDTVRAYRLILARGRAHRPYNVCSGRAYRIADLLEALISMSSSRITVTVDPGRLRPSDNPVVLGDPSRLTAETGWQPDIPIERTLRDLLDYWRAATGHPPR